MLGRLGLDDLDEVGIEQHAGAQEQVLGDLDVVLTQHPHQRPRGIAEGPELVRELLAHDLFHIVHDKLVDFGDQRPLARRGLLVHRLQHRRETARQPAASRRCTLGGQDL